MKTQNISAVFNLQQVKKDVTTWIMDFFDESENETQQKNILSVIFLEPEFLLLLFSWIGNIAAEFLRMLSVKWLVKPTDFAEKSGNNDEFTKVQGENILVTNVERVVSQTAQSIVYICMRIGNSAFHLIKKAISRIKRIVRSGLSLILFIFAKILIQWISKRTHFKKIDMLLSRRLYC
ncbi:MAG: hypothetical protein LBV41_01905 [Cytophagaceae bacterium]|jgi:hypothetical protein|nr:hypothetical protein [Cytophagaceae bacterium]